ncbi:unnamed protein product [Kuraishia capsulata CBS 1993]|uniref:Anaphase-promoting complex subunit 4 WD40 domain-containing protein n=1 Tax=Kuraishia capsulata CBS 1993 TaxID=1382522 RepID=W6MQB1_9ASCO|nr:uncharacterized protein KUCA_T00000040001 [Kuraishia capsulata CBS 1993]CDK24080.1 unnamed protein product [Kuraishia capsulata CBS 1993]
MKESLKPFATGHEELIHDLAYDFYGRQLATCSSDQHIKVFDLDPNTSEWILNDSWKAHDSSVVKVAFAAPEFGHILASISYDRSVKIWEEDFDEQAGSGRRWKRLATISGSQGALYDIAFAPSHLGLRLGTIGSDGVLRIYDALEPSNLRNWTLISELSVLAVPPAANLQSDFSLTWSPSRFSPEKVLVCALDQAFIYVKDKNDRYVMGKMLPEHNGLIRSVSWAPTMGRSYHLIATGCKDGYVRIFKLTESLKGDDGLEDTVKELDAFATNGAYDSEPGSDIQIETLSTHNDHDGEVWKVSWNVTGTILSSAGDDGTIRLWKASYSNKYQCMSVISAQQK